MKRFSVSIDNLLASVQRISNRPGLLPLQKLTLMSSASVVATIGMDRVDRETVEQLVPLVLPYSHLVSDVRVAFWPHQLCPRCKSPFTPHSLLGRSVHIGWEPADPEDGWNEDENASSSALCSYDGREHGVALMPFEMREIDRTLLHIWTAIAATLRTNDSIGAPPAKPKFTSISPAKPSYWGLACPACDALVPDRHLKPPVTHSPREFAPMPMFSSPLVVVSTKSADYGDSGLAGLITGQLALVPFIW